MDKKPWEKRTQERKLENFISQQQVKKRNSNFFHDGFSPNWTGWWQLKHFLFSPLFGDMIQFDEHIFQRGGSTTNYVVED